MYAYNMHIYLCNSSHVCKSRYYIVLNLLSSYTRYIHGIIKFFASMHQKHAYADLIIFHLRIDRINFKRLILRAHKQSIRRNLSEKELYIYVGNRIKFYDDNDGKKIKTNSFCVANIQNFIWNRFYDNNFVLEVTRKFTYK